MHIQPTPNPDARKFILERPVVTQGKATFDAAPSAGTIPLVSGLFQLEGVIQVHLFENVVTVTKFERSWESLQPEIEAVLMTRILQHDPQFVETLSQDSLDRSDLPPEVQKIEEILDETVRAGLQADGGDIQVLEYVGRQLYVRYEGACGTCPSATTGTLFAIESILKDRFDPEIEVIPV